MDKPVCVSQYQAATAKRRKVSAFLILAVIPLIIATFVLFHQKYYMVVNFIVLAVTLCPFFMVFERRKPRARELVLITMMCSFTVGSQVVLHIFLPVQIGTAIIILSGISLGSEAGFLIGALSRLICNFYMGQGPWTPWQMFCWGILGFLAGLAFHVGQKESLQSRNFSIVLGPVLLMALALAAAWVCWLWFPGKDESFFGWRLYVFGALGLLAGVIFQRKRLSADSITLCLFTFFTTFVVYGGIMNISAMVTAAAIPSSGGIGWEPLRLLYFSAVPYDLYHAGTAALCVFFLGNGLISKLERIKIKYGIYR